MENKKIWIAAILFAMLLTPIGVANGGASYTTNSSVVNASITYTLDMQGAAVNTQRFVTVNYTTTVTNYNYSDNSTPQFWALDIGGGAVTSAIVINHTGTIVNSSPTLQSNGTISWIEIKNNSLANLTIRWGVIQQVSGVVTVKNAVATGKVLALYNESAALARHASPSVIIQQEMPVKTVLVPIMKSGTTATPTTKETTQTNIRDGQNNIVALQITKTPSSAALYLETTVTARQTAGPLIGPDNQPILEGITIDAPASFNIAGQNVPFIAVAFAIVLIVVLLIAKLLKWI